MALPGQICRQIIPIMQGLPINGNNTFKIIWDIFNYANYTPEKISRQHITMLSRGVVH